MAQEEPCTNPWLIGSVAPVYEEVTAHGLEVTGRIPDDLDGRFVKIGPNPLRPPRSGKRYKVFLADGMVHGVRLRDGRAEWYRNRWVRSTRASLALGERRVPGPRHTLLDSVNTHVIGHAGQTLALVEAGCTPAELSYDLETLRYTDFEGTLPGGFSAHPKRDPATGELHAITYRPLSRRVNHVVVGTDARVRQVTPVAVGSTPIMHDMALTENHVVLFDSPARLASPLQLLSGTVYRWKQGLPSRFGVLPRTGTGSGIRWFEIDPCFILHTLNAYEEGNRIVVVGIRYDRVIDETLAAASRPKAYLWRWAIDLVTGIVRDERLSEGQEEFPRIDDRRSTLRNRFGFTLGLAEPLGTEPDAVIKRDLATGATEIRRYPSGITPSEAVFVPRAGASAEDDGWVLTYVTSLAENRTRVCIHHAQAITEAPVATITLPVRVPCAFHGSWIPDQP